MIIDEHIASQNFSPLYLFYGEEAYLRRQFSGKLISALVREGDNMNFTKFEGDKTDLKEVMAQASTAPFFAQHRVVLVQNSGAFEKASDDVLVDYLNAPCPSTILIFIEQKVLKTTKAFKAINKEGSAIDCAPYDEKSLAGWIGSRLKAEGKTIDRDAYAEFLARTNSSMDNMDSELEKLLSYIGTNSSISKADVEAICTKQIEMEVFELVNAMRAKDATRTLAIYQELLAAKAAPMQLLYLLMNQFNSLYIVKDLMDQGLGKDAIISQTKMRPFAVEMNMRQARQFSAASLRSFLQQALDLEHQFKTGLIEDRLAVELLIVGGASDN